MLEDELSELGVGRVKEILKQEFMIDKKFTNNLKDKTELV